MIMEIQVGLTSPGSRPATGRRDQDLRCVPSVPRPRPSRPSSGARAENSQRYWVQVRQGRPWKAHKGAGYLSAISLRAVSPSSEGPLQKMLPCYVFPNTPFLLPTFPHIHFVSGYFAFALVLFLEFSGGISQGHVLTSMLNWGCLL